VQACCERRSQKGRSQESRRSARPLASGRCLSRYKEHRPDRGSRSGAKQAARLFRISLALQGSRFSRLNSTMRQRSSTVRPALVPRSICGWWNKRAERLDAEAERTGCSGDCPGALASLLDLSQEHPDGAFSELRWIALCQSR
jgi:hypothetical protein